jgi:hypothetical protein
MPSFVQYLHYPLCNMGPQRVLSQQHHRVYWLILWTCLQVLFQSLEFAGMSNLDVPSALIVFCELQFKRTLKVLGCLWAFRLLG